MPLAQLRPCFCSLQAMRDYEREKARAALASKQTKELEYLKNILLKLFETGELLSDFLYAIGFVHKRQGVEGTQRFVRLKCSNLGQLLPDRDFQT